MQKENVMIKTLKTNKKINNDYILVIDDKVFPLEKGKERLDYFADQFDVYFFFYEGKYIPLFFKSMLLEANQDKYYHARIHTRGILEGYQNNLYKNVYRLSEKGGWLKLSKYSHLEIDRDDYLEINLQSDGTYSIERPSWWYGKGRHVIYCGNDMRG